MSRRDTIIVAVLINAGLLIVLFASALKSSSPSAEFATNSTPMFIESAHREMPIRMGDEVDQALSMAASMPQSPAMPMQDTMAVLPAPIAPQAPMAPMAAQTSSFADDLKAITYAETPVMTSQPQNFEVPAVSAAAANFIEVKVKKGDVLEKIARQHHTTVSAIMQANKLGSTNLRIGQVLKVPGKSGASVATTAHSTPAQPAHQGELKLYTVKNGDNPWTIAVKNHMRVDELLKLNNLDEEKARRLKPGDQLKVR